jgi:hypothetical protein
VPPPGSQLLILPILPNSDTDPQDAANVRGTMTPRIHRTVLFPRLHSTWPQTEQLMTTEIYPRRALQPCSQNPGVGWTMFPQKVLCQFLLLSPCGGCCILSIPWFTAASVQLLPPSSGLPLSLSHSLSLSLCNSGV